MSAFVYSDGIDQEQLDFSILSKGPVGLYRSADQFGAAVETLVGLGYEVARIDAANWRTESDLFDAFVEQLDFPAYFGRNWDAFDEVIQDIGSGDLSWPHDATGQVVAIEHADGLSESHRQAAGLLVEIFADASRRASLFGNRLILIVQTGDDLGRVLSRTVTSPVASWR